MSALPPLPVDKRLPLDDSPRIAVFRAAESILRSDPTLKAVVDQWNTWRGKAAADKAPFGRGPAVCIALSLGKAPAGWFDPSTQRRVLAIDVLAEVSSPCLDDAENLWAAIERAFYPADDA